MSRNDHVPHSLRGNAGSTALPDPYQSPDDTSGFVPDGWTGTALENWRTYCDPIHSKLEDDEQTWYRRLYRPKHTGNGLLQTDDVTVGNECDYVAETIESTIHDREFRLERQRQVAKIRADVDLEAIAGTIVTAIREVSHETGRDPTEFVPEDKR